MTFSWVLMHVPVDFRPPTAYYPPPLIALITLTRKLQKIKWEKCLNTGEWGEW